MQKTNSQLWIRPVRPGLKLEGVTATLLAEVSIALSDGQRSFAFIVLVLAIDATVVRDHLPV